MSEIWCSGDAEIPPDGADPLLWELGQLRKVAQGALAHAVRTRNLPATASLLRAANGLLDLLARIEKAKAEEEAKQAAVAALPPAAVREELRQWLDSLRARLKQAEAAQKPPEPPAEKPVREAAKPPEPGAH